MMTMAMKRLTCDSVELGLSWYRRKWIDPAAVTTLPFRFQNPRFWKRQRKLKAANVEFFLARSDTALYFFDYDNHVFELDTTDLDRELA